MLFRSSNEHFITYTPNDASLIDKLICNKMQVSAEPEEEAPWYVTIFISWFPMLLLIGV